MQSKSYSLKLEDKALAMQEKAQKKPDQGTGQVKRCPAHEALHDPWERPL